jgi:adenine-specific DNA-methyltransferase
VPCSGLSLKEKPMATSKSKTTNVKKAAAGDSAKGANQPVDALVHKADERLFIPSREEAGQEQESLAGRPSTRAVPLNPVTTRGQDPELYWLGKYGPDDQQTRLDVDIRSLYRHEHIEPEQLIARLYKLKNRDDKQNDLFVNELHGNPLALDELDKPVAYYRRQDKWRNRLIQGDSLLVMTSLLEREGMAGAVQCIYIDPPYGIKYGSNWQMRQNDVRMPQSDPDEALSGEGEVIKAFRDTWELGIHSYLSYLRDRLLVARELLSESGSCFVQISDENVHLVRNLMDEVFGSENFISLIPFRKKTMPLGGNYAEQMADFIIWYGKRKFDGNGRPNAKYRPLTRRANVEGEFHHCWYELESGERVRMTTEQVNNHALLPKGARVYRTKSLEPSGPMESGMFSYQFEGRQFPHPKNGYGTKKEGLDRLVELRRLQVEGTRLTFVMYADESSAAKMTVPWFDTVGADDKRYVVQTNTEVVRRCILMTTDPGDLVLDPTCGSGTTAFVAEHWGRRWITSDTSRIALNVSKARLLTATFPWYALADRRGEDIRHGFDYKTALRVTLGSLANGEPPATETLFDQPKVDSAKLRVTGPFTVETLQSFEPLSPDCVQDANLSRDNIQRFLERVFEHLKHAGIKNGLKNEMAVFSRVDLINEETGVLHAEGWYGSAEGEKKAYLHIGPQFGTVSKKSVNDAVKACRQRADADWLVLLGFGFESDVDNRNVTLKVGSFEVTKVRMHDDLMQDGLIKKDKKAASFVTIGEPDVGLVRDGSTVQVEIRGLDLYDPMADEVKERSVADISYWMLDDDYDGANFVVRQVFFCGGDADEFDKFKRGLSALAISTAKAKVERTLKLEIDDEAFDRVYGHKSHPVPAIKGRRLAVRVVSQFGEESTKVLVV